MITPTDLTCEYAPNPISIDTLQPRFGWLLESDRRNQSQSAYQILVASSAENLLAGRGDKWDSGKVNSGPLRQCRLRRRQPVQRRKLLVASARMGPG